MEKRGEIPLRGDGKRWTPRHLRAAQLRAGGKSWRTIADEVDVAVQTVYNYTCIDGWHELVSHYQEVLFTEQIESHFRAGSLEALDALKATWRQRLQEIEDLEEAIEDGTEREEDVAKVLFSRSKAVALSAGVYLDAIGFKTARRLQMQQLYGSRDEEQEDRETRTTPPIQDANERALRVAKLMERHGLLSPYRTEE